MLQTFGDYAEGERLYASDSFVSVLAVGHNAGQGRHLGEPAAVDFALDFNRERHQSNVPFGPLPNKAIGQAPRTGHRHSVRPKYKTGMVTVRYEDLSAAFDFVSFGAPFEHRAYISMDTGTIYWISESNPTDEEVPDDLEESDRYIAIPHKYDLDLGSHLVVRFAAEQLPDQYARIEGFFRHRGAYARFKELLAAEGQLEKWYAFEAASTEKALKDWCADNSIDVIHD
jgi:hypothetical protein